MATSPSEVWEVEYSPGVPPCNLICCAMTSSVGRAVTPCTGATFAFSAKLLSSGCVAMACSSSPESNWRIWSGSLPDLLAISSIFWSSLRSSPVSTSQSPGTAKERLVVGAVTVW